ncbi:MAG TPA: NAD(P)H-dependent glycerol-3-phosphate dehydrogenase [Candidatus Deferrimicrobium sp.]|nr:NAD(P)H-dependent glycerol-3-phosphate dehydrogenase [Candidatus Deferrimicrobium sp.]
MKPEKVTILGAGSWGMAVARLLHLNGWSVTLWEFDRDEFEKLRRWRGHPDKLQGFVLPEGITFSHDAAEAAEDCSLAVLAIPSQFLRSVLRTFRLHLDTKALLVNLAKGIETRTLMRMSEVITDELHVPVRRVVTLSGPSHAEEVILDIPTAVVAAGTYDEIATQVQETFSSRSFRVYKSDDLIGVELGGSLKNIIAIATGISDGLGLGDNTRGAIITRGLAEITRLGVVMGARAETFAGLSGIGDLVTTCASHHSRNRYVGEKIGQGQSLKDILAGMSMVAEGVETTRSGHDLARLHNVEMPITKEVYAVLFEGKSPHAAVEELMVRQLKTEIWR